MSNQQWEFYIAGVQHHEARTVKDQLEVGDFLNLVPEPTNKFDPNAIRIEWYSEITDGEGFGKSVMLGFVPAKLSADVSAFIEVEDKAKCQITELNPDAKPWEWIKVKIDA